MKLIKLCSWIAGYLIVMFFAFGNDIVVVGISVGFVISYFWIHLEEKEPTRKSRPRIPTRKPGIIPHKVTTGAKEMLNFYTPSEVTEWLQRTYSYSKETASQIVKNEIKEN